MAKLNVGIIFGGVSSEHDGSRVSAESIIKNISKEKYNLYLIGITKLGKWILFSGDISKIPSGEWENDENNKSAFISPDSDIKGLVVCDNGKYETINLDVVIPALHGKNGEDGTIQGLFKLAKIPFVGCDVLGACCCMDKIVTNTVLAANGISKPKYHWFYEYEFKNDPEKCMDDTEKVIGKYPMFVKPSNAGSSVGVSKASNREELKNAIEIAAKEDDRILIEEGIVGKEVECAVLGNENPIASVPGEIAPSNDFYDYEAKYINGTSELFIPARVSDEVLEKVKKEAIKAYRVMDCKGLSRVDFFVENDTQNLILNEINTFPGFTNISMYPKLMEKSGIGFSELIDKLICLAMN